MKETSKKTNDEQLAQYDNRVDLLTYSIEQERIKQRKQENQTNTELSVPERLEILKTVVQYTIIPVEHVGRSVILINNIGEFIKKFGHKEKLEAQGLVSNTAGSEALTWQRMQEMITVLQDKGVDLPKFMSQLLGVNALHGTPRTDAYLWKTLGLHPNKTLLPEESVFKLLGDEHQWKAPINTVIANEMVDRAKVMIDQCRTHPDSGLDNRDWQGKTALVTAAKVGGRVADIIVPKLLEPKKLDIDVNAQDNEGRSALMYLALYGKYKLVKESVAKGADITLKDKQGRTVADYARMGEEGVCAIAGSIEVNVKRDVAALYNSVEVVDPQLILRKESPAKPAGKLKSQKVSKREEIERDYPRLLSTEANIEAYDHAWRTGEGAGSYYWHTPTGLAQMTHPSAILLGLDKEQLDRMSPKQQAELAKQVLAQVLEDRPDAAPHVAEGVRLMNTFMSAQVHPDMRTPAGKTLLQEYMAGKPATVEFLDKEMAKRQQAEKEALPPVIALGDGREPGIRGFSTMARPAISTVSAAQPARSAATTAVNNPLVHSSVAARLGADMHRRSFATMPAVKLPMVSPSFVTREVLARMPKNPAFAAAAVAGGALLGAAAVAFGTKPAQGNYR